MIESKKYCKFIPYGKWLCYSAFAKEKFEVNYNITSGVGLIKYDIRYNIVEGEELVNFDNPVFPNLENGFPIYIHAI